MNPSPPLVDRRLHGADAGAFSHLPRLDLAPGQVLDLEKIANGTFTPLEGFMGSGACQSVMEEMRLPGGEPWPIPILLQVERASWEELREGPVLLWNAAEDAPAGILELRERFMPDLEELARRVYGTTDRAHPGVERMVRAGPRCVAGPVRLIRRSRGLIPPAYDLAPAEVRAEIARRGWRTVTGFQTRNLGHRAHERLQKIGLELTDGLLVHPLLGWKKPGDMLPEVILEGYEILLKRYFPAGRTLLAGLTTAMRYAGPREAVFHALIRRNFGCTHFIVGRDHAGVGGFYERYAAHRIFDRFRPGELGITPLRLHGPCYCRVCGEIVTEAVCPHGPEGWDEISGTEIRAMVARGERPPPTVMRPEIAEFLVQRAQNGPVFFEGP